MPKKQIDAKRTVGKKKGRPAVSEDALIIAEKLWMAGTAKSDIAEAVGISERALRKYAKKLGWRQKQEVISKQIMASASTGGALKDEEAALRAMQYNLSQGIMAALWDIISPKNPKTGVRSFNKELSIIDLYRAMGAVEKGQKVQFLALGITNDSNNVSKDDLTRIVSFVTEVIKTHVKDEETLSNIAGELRQLDNIDNQTQNLQTQIKRKIPSGSRRPSDQRMAEESS